MEYLAWVALGFGSVLSITAMTVVAVAWKACLSRSSKREDMMAGLVVDLAKDLRECAAQRVVNTDNLTVVVGGRPTPAKAVERNENETE